MIPVVPWLVTAAQWLLGGAFLSYLVATWLSIAGYLGHRLSGGTAFTRTAGRAQVFQALGLILHGLAILARWQGAGHWPTSNMYEFIGFLAYSSMLACFILQRIYHAPVLGAAVGPVGIFLMAYSYVFPPKVAPLVPALKSIWLPLHVSLAALGEGFFAVAFGAALLYLLRMRGLELTELSGAGAAAGAVTARRDWESVWGQRGLELLFYGILTMVGFVILALPLRHWVGTEWVFTTATYHLPPIIGPSVDPPGSKGTLLGFIPIPLVAAPPPFRGKHLNTLLFSLVVGGLLYGLIRRFVAQGPISDYLARRVGGDPELLDEISYRAVAIGYPIFTLGALVFAMFWAKEAWSRYWSWDPKETWALIAWLVYSAYLHLRISRGWEGRRSAWVAVLGFGVILFTLVGVNLLIVGLHSYAGGD
ncbi:MAG TPA: cytochrome c biogenesis protein CcsA [Symbiobacteriaceae bacterium]